MNKSFWKARVKPLIIVKCFPVLGFQQVVRLEKEKIRHLMGETLERGHLE